MVNFDTYSAEHPELFKDDEPDTPTSSRNANTPSPSTMEKQQHNQISQQQLEQEPDFTSFHLGFTYDFHPSLSDPNTINANNAQANAQAQPGRAATAQGAPPPVNK